MDTGHLSNQYIIGMLNLTVYEKNSVTNMSDVQGKK